MMKGNLLININFCIFALITDVGEKLKKKYLNMNDEIEVWEDIEGYEGYYQVSNKGNVKSVDRVVNQYSFSKNKFCDYIYKGNILKPDLCKDYSRVTLSKDNKTKRFFVHQLVLKTFVGIDENRKCIDHIDGDRRNNNVNNLRWATHKENNNNPITLKRLSESLKGKEKQEPIKVDRCDMDWNVLETYDSMKDARRKRLL